MASSSQKSDGLMTEINVTPLVDVVLVLLVLMMVTATALAQKTIHVELPKARSGDAESAKKPLTVAVDEAGALFVDTDRVDESGLRARAREAFARDAQVSAVLAADGRARHETVVHALELLRGERISKIAIVVRAEATP
ncbi:MAG TPA: biopolymer transporter ExbD [Labilithrix sp.]|nr:biopolymer transporter ExbD [Labilithrix sp.]